MSVEYLFIPWRIVDRASIPIQSISHMFPHLTPPRLRYAFIAIEGRYVSHDIQEIRIYAPQYHQPHFVFKYIYI